MDQENDERWDKQNKMSGFSFERFRQNRRPTNENGLNKNSLKHLVLM
jgi:hypothetical protein